jgi:ABC-type hemin transport system ATPase subunit
VPELSAVENVSLPLLLEGRPRRESLAESAGWLELLGIGDLGARRSGELSGGEAQPVALARALALASDPRAPVRTARRRLWLALVGGRAVALAVVSATLPLLDRLTAPESVRIE